MTVTERERWLRIANAAQLVTTGCEDTGEDFIVPSHLMASLALALDEGPKLVSTPAPAGLTDAELAWCEAWAEKALLKLREAPTAAPEIDTSAGCVEPVEKWCLFCSNGSHFTAECRSTVGLNDPEQREIHRLCVALHAAPPVASKPPLTDEQIENLIDLANRRFNGRRRGPCGQQITSYDDWKYWLVRVVEAAIREQS